MAYTLGVFFLDYVNGNDAARTTLSGVVFSNPSADIVLGTKVGHGLVTGAVITVSGCTQAYANTAWKVTRVNDDTFTLDSASWASFNGADVTGDAVPFGGQSWADAWKTITSGATAARIAPGDIVKIAKSPAPTILGGATGHATWTNLSKTVTLADAQTATIDLCESAWTAGAGGDVTVAATGVATTAKEGSYCMKLTFDAAPQASIMEAYKATGTLDLSAYQKISFWIQNSGAVTAGTLRIALCSDNAGATPVDYFYIPAIPSTARWLPLTLTKSGGGNLGSSIQSIALYTDSAVTGLASKFVYLDDIIACTTAGLNLQSLISKNALETGGTEVWYAIQSINGVTVLLDNNTPCKSNAGRGYSTTGTSPETVDTYIRETVKLDMVTTDAGKSQELLDSGTFAGGNIQFLGGYDITDATGATRNGITFWDALNSYGCIYSKNNAFISLDMIYMVRAHSLVYSNTFGGTKFWDVGEVGAISCKYGFYNNPPLMSVVDKLVLVNNWGPENVGGANYKEILSVGEYWTTGAVYSSSSGTLPSTRIQKATCLNSGGVGWYSSVPIRIENLTTKDNYGGGVTCANFVGIELYNATINESTEVVFLNPGCTNNRVFSQNHNGSGVHKIFFDYGLIVSDTTNRHTASGVCWKLSPTNVARNSLYPLELSIAKVACAASALVTVKAWIKKSHATDIGAKLLCKGGQIAGVATDVSATKANDTYYEELTITFTPTEAGVVEIVVQAYWLANTADESVYIDDMTITQA